MVAGGASGSIASADPSAIAVCVLRPAGPRLAPSLEIRCPSSSASVDTVVVVVVVEAAAALAAMVVVVVVVLR